MLAFRRACSLRSIVLERQSSTLYDSKFDDVNYDAVDTNPLILTRTYRLLLSCPRLLSEVLRSSLHTGKACCKAWLHSYSLVTLHIQLRSKAQFISNSQFLFFHCSDSSCWAAPWAHPAHLRDNDCGNSFSGFCISRDRFVPIVLRTLFFFLVSAVCRIQATIFTPCRMPITDVHLVHPFARVRV